MKPHFAVIALGLSLSALQPLAAKTSNNFAASYELLRSRDAMLQNAGWRLLRGNAVFCDDTRYSAGFTIDDAAAFSDPAAFRKATAISGDFVIQSVADGSPAMSAGLLPGREIIAVDGYTFSNIIVDPTKPWARSAAIAELLLQKAADKQSIAVELAGTDQPVLVSLLKVCVSRLEIATGGRDAVADGERVVLDRDFVGFTYPEEEFAAVVAHELAHNFLRHRTYLDKKGRKRRYIRQTEREADRLMPWLLANADYPPEAAVWFMRRWGPEHSGGLRFEKKHDGWDERLELIEQELPVIAASIARHGVADWKQDFVPQFSRD